MKLTPVLVEIVEAVVFRGGPGGRQEGLRVARHFALGSESQLLYVCAVRARCRWSGAGGWLCAANKRERERGRRTRWESVRERDAAAAADQWTRKGRAAPDPPPPPPIRLPPDRLFGGAKQFRFSGREGMQFINKWARHDYLALLTLEKAHLSMPRQVKDWISRSWKDRTRMHERTYPTRRWPSMGRWMTVTIEIQKEVPYFVVYMFVRLSIP